MVVPVFTHLDCLRHDPGSSHPETPARLEVLLDRARAQSGVKLVEASAASREALLPVHPDSYLRTLESMSARGGGVLFLDTVLNGASWKAALGATGAVLAAVDHAHEGLGHAFAAVRPPGHHALAGKGMGFCLVNNVVVAARYAQAELGLERVAIVDYDVHHGNGTEAIFRGDDSVFFVSLHQWPFYPGTGGPGTSDESTLNLPLRAGIDDDGYIAVFEGQVVPAVRGFAPDLVLVSAGFDAHEDDPIGGLGLTDAAFRELGTICSTLGPRVAAVLEGGYNLATLPRLVAAAREGLSC